MTQGLMARARVAVLPAGRVRHARALFATGSCKGTYRPGK